jgi:HD-like signal output (HDOD) protein
VPRRILFVDDEQNLLMGLQRSLRPMRAEWEMEFVSTGDEALKVLSLRPFDAIVTDMRMPVMSGTQLLEKVQELRPQTIRIILSGQADRESVLRSITSSHQFLSKPCDPEQLRLLLARTIALADLLENASLKSFMAKLKSIPSLPALYREVTQELRSDSPSASKIGEIIAKDMGMTAKILQIANSAAHGIRMEISEPSRAVQLLGLDAVETMVLSLSIFSILDTGVLSPAKVEQLWNRSLSISGITRLIASAEGVAGRDLDAYQTAGLLHNIGELVLTSADPKAYRAVEKRITSTGSVRSQVETEILGCGHAEVGAYLLGIWGLPTSIVEAVAWHHNPMGSMVTQFCPLAAVHVACAFDTQFGPDGNDFGADLDQAFLERIGLGGRLEVWSQRCAEHLEEKGRT